MEFFENRDSYTSQDGLKIFYRNYRANDERAGVVIAHGLGEHSGRYRNVIGTLLPRGISIWALDHRGHGQSDGPRGHVLAFEEYLNDLRTIVQIAKRELPTGMKCFLLGHSMGGLIALNFALRFPEMIDGVIASSPTLGIAVKVPALKGFFGKVMSSIWPGLLLRNEIDVSKISHDEEVVRAYVEDPLVHDRVSTRWFTEFFSAMEEANQSASKLAVPTLIQAAGEDYLANATDSKQFFEKMTLNDITFHVYEGLYHEIYNEREGQRAKVLNDLEVWMEAHI
jgi:alpha-beta hydrolase superfamily lysophospholipase